MTFKIGNNQIHIDFWASFVIISTFCTCTWTVKGVFDGFNDNQAKILTQQSQILSTLRKLDKKDSIQDVVIITLKAKEVVDSTAIVNIHHDLAELEAIVDKKHVIDYFTERRVKGHIDMMPYKNH